MVVQRVGTPHALVRNLDPLVILRMRISRYRYGEINTSLIGETGYGCLIFLFSFFYGS